MAELSQAGDHAILVTTDRQYWVFVELSPQNRFKFLKKSYSAKALIGAPYGSVFEVQGTQIKRVEGKMSSELALDTLIGPEDERKAGPSVEETVDGAQVLDGDSISALRASGASGQEIIAALVENSATFKDKTEFAKQKYLKKKAIKYVQRLRLLKGCARYLIEAFFLRSPLKICYLRHDSLAQLLAYANVRSGADMLVAESCNGFISGCVAEKMGGCGRIFNVHPMFKPNLVYFKQFNVKCDVNQLVIGVPIDTLTGKPPSKPVYVYEPRAATSSEDPATAFPSAAASPPPETAAGADDVDLPADGGVGAEPEAADRPNKKKRKRAITADDETRAAWRLEAQKAPAAALLHLREHGADGLIIVVDSHPLALLLQLVRYLKPSCPFVVFSRFLEPLAECFRQLKHYGLATRLAINETWTRHYQMLEGRCHPEMTVSGNPGFILWGYTLCHPHSGVKLHASHEPLVYTTVPEASSLKASVPPS